MEMGEGEARGKRENEIGSDSRLGSGVETGKEEGEGVELTLREDTALARVSTQQKPSAIQ